MDDPDLLDDTPLAYDADEAPTPDAWLALDEHLRMIAVERHHERGLPGHPPTPSPEVHAAMHTAVETQLAMNEPPATAAALRRLLSEGLDRHEAIHAIASILARTLHDMLATSTPFDGAAYDRELEQLTASSWRASGPPQPTRPRPPARRAGPKRRRR